MRRAKDKDDEPIPVVQNIGPEEPNDIWGADYKGQFRLKNGTYCYPETVSDLYSRFVLGCDGHPEISLELTK